jgi:uncharacterized membrane protein
MDIHEDTEVGKVEKITRFVCGALLGVVFGFYLVFKYDFSSLGSAACVIIAATCLCGYFALKFGDEFWYSVLGRHR